MLFAQIGPLFTSHWQVVVLISVLFFVTQIFLTTRFILRTTKQRRMLRSLQSHLDEGGDGRVVAEGTVVSFAWAQWVTEVFPSGTEIPGNYTRDDVLQELDTRIASSSDYLLLQRLGVIAPLLGVILTVAGFAWLEVPENAESLDNILFAVTPLVAGVGAGAILAFINQFLLHLAGNKARPYERPRATGSTRPSGAILAWIRRPPRSRQSMPLRKWPIQFPSRWHNIPRAPSGWSRRRLPFKPRARRFAMRSVPLGRK